MSDQTAILSLPLIMPSQAQKHVTHNEALRVLDVAVQLAVTNRTRTTPPASPALGDRYIIASGASGAWAGLETQIAFYTADGWDYIAPMTGWQAYISAEDGIAVYSGAAWVIAGASAVVPQLGINATADSTNRLTVSAPATLLNHEGAGHQLKVNKAAAGDTASLLFQTGFSGRAEMGTAGSDAFAIKVSADGSAYATALTAAGPAGNVSLPSGVLASGFTLRDGTDTTKAAVFSLSGITTGTTRSYSLPNTSGEIALLAGAQTFTGAKGFAAKVSLAASTAGGAGVNLAPGVAPSAPVDGDVWTTSAGVFARVNGVTVPLDSAGGGATDLAYTAATRLLASSTGADVTLPLVGADAGLMAAADKTKLDGVATGATANSADAVLLARANHSGTQAASTITGLATVATSGSASDLGAGTLSAARMPAHTGDATSTAGSVALTIANDAVSNAKLANMAANSLKGNNTGSSADPVDLTVAQVKTLLGYTAGEVGAQPADADLTSLAAASATNALYYRSAADTWSPVTIGANLTFAAGTLAASGGGGGGVSDGDKGDVVVSGGGTVWTVDSAGGNFDVTGTMTAAIASAGQLGVNTTANSTRRLSVQAAETQLSHDGSSHTLRINKSSGLNDAKIQLTNALSARAEFGLIGSTETTLRTSPDGSSWNDALTVNTAGEATIWKPITLPANATPATPAADTLGLFGRSLAGRMMPAIIGPSGIDTSLQPFQGTNRVGMFLPAGNGAVTTQHGVAYSSSGSATTANVATTNRFTRMRGIEYLVTTAATTAAAGFRGAANQWTVGAATAGDGGFLSVLRWGPATGVSTTTTRAFAGMRPTAAPTDVEPSTFVNMVGMGWDAADTNIQMMHNDGSGTATKIDLGASFPVPTVDRTSVYEIALFSPPGTTQSVGYRVTNLATGAEAVGTITTDLPSNTTLISPVAQMTVGGTSSVIGIKVFSHYIETDY